MDRSTSTPSNEPAGLPELPPGLVYTRDTSPGILRKRRGKGFSYVRANGQPVTDARELQRIRRLAIPPAYRNVWICPRPNGHLQATGLDARGRKQYRYHPAWREGRDEEKFGGLPEFAARLPRLRRHTAKALAGGEHCRGLLLAAVVRLLDTTYGRIGNDQYARDNGSYGLTTLCDHHARVSGEQVELVFRGKSGVEHSLHLCDARVARAVRHCMGLPGESLFRYVDGAGAPRAISSADVNEYLKRVTGADVTAKDFRTWHATVLALDVTARALERGKRCTLKTMLATVSEALGNTPAVCRRSYVHPQVVALATLATRDPEGALELLQRAGAGPQRAGLKRGERRLLAFLAHVDGLHASRAEKTSQRGKRKPVATRVSAVGRRAKQEHAYAA